MLASDGRCKTLDASADGYVRAEDCVILVLEEATAATDSDVLLSGTAVNQVHPLSCHEDDHTAAQCSSLAVCIPVLKSYNKAAHRLDERSMQYMMKRYPKRTKSQSCWSHSCPMQLPGHLHSYRYCQSCWLQPCPLE